MHFVGRKKELDYLKTKYSSDQVEFIIVYGRRRLGKTRLLKESIRENEGATYYLCTQETNQKNIDQFKTHLSRRLQEPLIEKINADSWVSLFETIQQLLPEKYVLLIDEFPYLLTQDKSLLSQFQKIYDEYLKPKKCTLVLCGSSLSLMSDLMQHDSPLYGRRTASIELKAFTLHETSLFLHPMRPEDILATQLSFGGIPYYLEQLDPHKNYEENIRKLFFAHNSIFHDEATFLLKEEFREIRTYLSILKAISKGKNTFATIADDSQLDRGSLSKYLVNLELIGLVEPLRSFFDKQNSKKTIYQIRDNYLYFWFNAIEKHLNRIENKEVQEKILKEDIPRTCGNLFEKEVQRILQPQFERIGKYFKKDVEIDLLGKNANTITCIECKYQQKINEHTIQRRLKEKITTLPKGFDYKTRIIAVKNEKQVRELIQLSKR